MYKLGIAFIILVAIFVIINEWRKANKKEDAKKELLDVTEELRNADMKEDVVDAKVKLKKRNEKINKKAEVLVDKTDDKSEEKRNFKV